jgi:hypothetical protein
MLRINSLRWKGKCPKHSHFDSAAHGVGAVRGGCVTCSHLIEIHQSHEHTLMLRRTFLPAPEASPTVATTITLPHFGLRADSVTPHRRGVFMVTPAIGICSVLTHFPSHLSPSPALIQFRERQSPLEQRWPLRFIKAEAYQTSRTALQHYPKGASGTRRKALRSQ